MYFFNSGALLQNQVSFLAICSLHHSVTDLEYAALPFAILCILLTQQRDILMLKAELGRLLSNCRPLLITDTMMKIVVSNVI